MNALETKVLQLIGENTSSPDVFSDITPIRDSINDAVEELSMLLGWYKEKYYLPLRKGIGFYRVRFSQGEFAYITNVFHRGNKYRLQRTDFQKIMHDDPRWQITQADPREYFQFGADIIGVYPAPSATEELLEITTVTIPDRYTQDTDRVKLRDSHVWATAHYAVSEYYASRGDTQQATIHFEDYLEQTQIAKSYNQAQDRTYQNQTVKE